jgi:serine/threonine-protein kinase HipA
VSRELAVLLEGRSIGRITQDASARLSFVYEAGWADAPGSYPISLSMPLSQAEHGHDRIEPFIRGLLPDNAQVLAAWGRHFHVSPRNSFGLLAHVGEDCAGALQVVSPDRADALLSLDQSGVTWLDESEVAARLRLLRQDPSAWRLHDDGGQFSLAGAQAKTALHGDGERWGVPRGHTPTTHILKPPTQGFEGLAQNEHFCLELARLVGLPAAQSRVVHFEDEPAIIVERYDRLRTGGDVRRIHQEDMCQALGVTPLSKYEAEGGPGIVAVTDLLRRWSREPVRDSESFLRACILNWLIVGTDAHAKNYAVMIAAGVDVRLAPLYDVISALPYDRSDPQRVKLAMRVGGKYRVRDIGIRQWRALGAAVHVPQARIEAMIQDMLGVLPAAAEQVRGWMREDAIHHPVVDRLVARITERVAAVSRGIGM